MGLDDVRSWADLERWFKSSSRTQRLRIPQRLRVKLSGNLKFIERARHHTTKGRTKSERMMDTYWFVPIENAADYRELASQRARMRSRRHRHGRGPDEKHLVQKAYSPYNSRPE